MGEGVCGLHICGKCGLPVLVFGVLFLLRGLNYLPAVLNEWVIFGLFFGLLGLMSFMGKK
jgi:hypothetical protein